jgi:hypothetical protein
MMLSEKWLELLLQTQGRSPDPSKVFAGRIVTFSLLKPEFEMRQDVCIVLKRAHQLSDGFFLRLSFHAALFDHEFSHRSVHGDCR